MTTSENGVKTTDDSTKSLVGDDDRRMDADNALRLLGRFSRWQVVNYLCCASGFGVAFAWILMTVVFIGDVPNYRCALPPNGTLNTSIPLVEGADGQWEYDKCSMYADDSGDSNETVPCQYGYWYDPESGYTSTIVSQWDLVCGKEWLVELSMTLQSVGKIIGAIFFNRLSDMHGRKMVFLGCLWANVVIASVRAASPSIIFYTLMAFLGGIVQQGMICASYILAVELFPTKQRSTAGTVIEFFWAFGYMSVSPMAYWLRDWRHLELATALPFILTIPYYWILSESVPWLVVNRRYSEADAILRKAARMNGKSLPDQLFQSEASLKKGRQMALLAQDHQKPAPLNHLAGEEDTKDMLFEDSSEGSSTISTTDSNNNLQYSVRDVFRNRALRGFALVLFVMWFVICLCYTGINFTVTYLPGNRYLNFFLYGLMEVPAYAFTWLLAEKGSRRWSLMTLNSIGGAALVCSVILPKFDFASSIEPLIITLSMAGKLMVTSSIALIYVVVPEIFPTNVRNIGMGMCQSFGRFGTLISPFARVLHREVAWLPSLVIGLTAIGAGFLALLLPETRQTRLPDSMEEVEQMRRGKGLTCCGSGPCKHSGDVVTDQEDGMTPAV